MAKEEFTTRELFNKLVDLQKRGRILETCSMNESESGNGMTRYTKTALIIINLLSHQLRTDLRTWEFEKIIDAVEEFLGDKN